MGKGLLSSRVELGLKEDRRWWGTSVSYILVNEARGHFMLNLSLGKTHLLLDCLKGFFVCSFCLGFFGEEGV